MRAAVKIIGSAPGRRQPACEVFFRHAYHSYARDIDRAFVVVFKRAVDDEVGLRAGCQRADDAEGYFKGFIHRVDVKARFVLCNTTQKFYDHIFLLKALILE